MFAKIFSKMDIILAIIAFFQVMKWIHHQNEEYEEGIPLRVIVDTYSLNKV